MKSRILILFSVFIGLWGVLLIRAASLQIFPNSRLEHLKRRQFETSLQIRTRRGAILDRQGAELAASVPAFSLFADPKLIEDPEGLSVRLGKYLRVPSGRLRKALRYKQRRFVWVKRQLSERQRDEIKRWQEPGLGFVEEPRRVYPNGSLLAQVLGFVGSEGNGLEGLELQYDRDLQGQLKTILLPRDARGRPLLEDGRTLTEVPDGADLQLTIDHEIQFSLERELGAVIAQFEADSGVGIVMDAQTSEVLALANMPTTDLSDLHHASVAAKRNRSITDAMEPGSTLKPFVIAGGLRDGILKPGTRYNCEGGKLKIGDKWITEADVHHKFTNLTVSEILAVSSNIGVAKIAFDMGDERLFRTLNDFGFGTKTDIGLPGEARGIVNPLPWRPHLLSNVAFGQGIAVTPLQMAAAYTAIANGGVLRKPLLVKSVKLRDQPTRREFQAEDVRRVMTTTEAATMRLMLANATEPHSTGANARIPGYHVGGKTGTAQKPDFIHGGYSKTAYISSFAGFVPAGNPRYVLYLAVDNPKKGYYGSQVAAPLFAKMAQYLVRRAGLPPVMISERNVISSTEQRISRLQAQALSELKRGSDDAERKGFPNLLGLTLREAMVKIRGTSPKVDVRGHGLVVRTVPGAGVEAAPKRVTLVLENPD